MRPRWSIALLISGVLVISAGAQDTTSAQSTKIAMAHTSRQQPSGGGMSPAQMQVQPGLGNPNGIPQQQMDAVLGALSDDLVRIAQAVKDGNISRPQAEYLSVESYYVGLARFQLLRAQYLNASDANQRELYSQANTAPPASDTVIVIPAPTSSPDASPQIASYLELNPAQLAAIQAQIENDRKQVQPLLQQLESSRRQLLSTTLNGKFDVEEVQTLAAEQSRILEQLMVANAMLVHKVYGMLTTEQQQKVDELRRRSLASVNAVFPEW